MENLNMKEIGELISMKINDPEQYTKILMHAKEVIKDFAKLEMEVMKELEKEG